jgi:acetylornithine deacetylase/succinyl-diaminopimelate desuccinylase-like protein
MTDRVPGMWGPLVADVRGRRDEIVELARSLVSIPSDQPAHDERAVVEALRDAAAALDLPAGEIHAALPGRPNLLIRLPGHEPGPSILLNGHVDTKPPGNRDLWPADPWDARVEDGLLHGLGSADMKGAVAAMVHAAAGLRRHRLPVRGELLLAFTADEEADGVLGLAHLVQRAGLRPDAAIIGEPSGLLRSFDTLPVGSRGFVGFRLVARGTRVHSALADRLPRRTAIASLARAIDRLPQLVDFGGPWPAPFEAGPTLSVATSLSAGVAAGIVPDVALATGDVRTVPGQSRDAVIAALQVALRRARDEAGGDLDVTLEPDPEDWPATLIDPALPLVGALSMAAAAVVGRTPEIGAFPGATEAHVLDALGIPCVPAFGPGMLARAHVPAESVPVDDLASAAVIYALAVAALLG